MPESSAAGTIEALLVELDGPGRSDNLLDELRSLHARQVLSVIDMVVVSRDADGTVHVRGNTELSADEAARYQASASDALGFKVGRHESGGIHWDGSSVLLGDEDVRFIARMLKPGQEAVAVVFEHRWAQRLSDLLHERGIRLVEDDVYVQSDASQTGGVPQW